MGTVKQDSVAPIAQPKRARRKEVVYDLHPNRDSPEFQRIVHAYETGERVDVTGMSHDDFMNALLGKRTR